MILFGTSSVELFIKLHSSTIALLQECQDNILMKLSTVSVKTAAERNARALRREYQSGVQMYECIQTPRSHFLEKGKAAENECVTHKL